ncbi:rod shape-determining protein MreC [Herbaspirillum sp. ST 5-3]|uniref:rod shape-determining protein MreC n=1 Tax=Oxalobacteraceae TaxID=75682 RepID=UPI0010A33483|nr:rod shape-determining protein MreC [Herbaspirillum sp. ST 5-3]
MEYSPPPLFKQGASARAKVVFFSLIALILLVADSRMRSLTTIRQVVGTMLYPLQVAALLPRDAAYRVGDYFSSMSALQKENNRMKEQQVVNAQTLQQVQQLAAENAQLRKLLAANERVPVRSILSEILYDARDPFTRKIVLDRGSQHGVSPGQPVIDDIGVVGQVTRVFPFTSEVTLLTDKEQAIPVQVVRSGLRSIAYGQGHSGSLDLRFMPANADIKNGDILVTSGIDGVYPAGLSVAKVVQVESKSSDAFARIVCQPMAGIDRNRQLLILLTEANFPVRPAPEESRDKKDKLGKKHAAEGLKEPAKETPKEPVKDGVKEQKNEAAPAAPEQKTPAAPAASPAVQKPATVAQPNVATVQKPANAPAVAPAAVVQPKLQATARPAPAAPQTTVEQKARTP